MLSPKEVVKKWVDAFNAGDVDMCMDEYPDAQQMRPGKR